MDSAFWTPAHIVEVILGLVVLVAIIAFINMQVRRSRAAKAICTGGVCRRTR